MTNHLGTLRVTRMFVPILKCLSKLMSPSSGPLTLCSSRTTVDQPEGRADEH
jgi:hypothetical protein